MKKYREFISTFRPPYGDIVGNLQALCEQYDVEVEINKLDDQSLQLEFSTPPLQSEAWWPELLQLAITFDYDQHLLKNNVLHLYRSLGIGHQPDAYISFDDSSK